MARKQWYGFAVACVITVYCGGSQLQGRQISGASPAADMDGSHLFPADTMVLLQIPDLGAIAEHVLNHPIRQKVESLQQVKRGLASVEFLQMRLGLALLESQLETDWLTALKSLSGKGICIGANFESQSVGLAVHASNTELLKKTVSTVLGFIRNQAGNGPEPFVVADYANGKIAKFNTDLTIGRFDAWLLISNHHDYLLQMADRLSQSKKQSSLIDSNSFQAARALVKNDADAWVYTDLTPIRASGQSQDLFRGMTEEPGVELLFGGILEALKDAPWLAADISIQPNQLAFNARLPYDAKRTPGAREFFFGPQGRGRAPAILDIPGSMLQMTTYRDLGDWWLNKEELFPENVIAQLAQGDSQLSTVFGGVDFGAEVLGTLQPGMRLIVKEQSYADGINPEIKLPALALVTRLQNPEQARRFRISFQSLVGLLNLAEGGIDRPQIDVLSSREDGIQMTAGTYAPEGGYDGSLLVFNFSPTLAFQDDYMIVSSTEKLAREVALKTKELHDAAESSESNTTISLSIPEISQILQLNRQSLVANQMLEQGISRTAAEVQIDLFLELLKFGRTANVDFRIEPRAMQLQLDLTFRSE